MAVWRKTLWKIQVAGQGYNLIFEEIKKIFIKFWRDENFLVQSVTPCEETILKFERRKKFQFKIWLVVKIFNPKQIMSE